MKTKIIDVLAWKKMEEGHKLSLKQKVFDMIARGVHISDLMDKLDITFTALNDIMNYKPSLKAVLGYKDDSYFTEEEMLNQKEYNYDDLSDIEKDIYNRIVTYKL